MNMDCAKVAIHNQLLKIVNKEPINVSIVHIEWGLSDLVIKWRNNVKLWLNSCLKNHVPTCGTNYMRLARLPSMIYVVEFRLWRISDLKGLQVVE